MNQTVKTRLGHVFAIAVPSMLIVSSIGNIVQFKAIKRAENREEAISGPARRPREEGMRIGQVLPPLPVQTMAGKSVALKYDDSDIPTVLYVFSPTCSWCNRNRPVIKQLATQAGTRYRFLAIAVNTADIASYAEETNLGFPVYNNRSRAGQLTYGLSSTPQTLVVARDGKLLKRWKGAYVGKQKDDIEAFFAVKLNKVGPGAHDKG
jgi:hypothetical protein